MDSVPSYRPASVPPPIVPTTPTPHEGGLPGPALIILGFLFGLGGMYLFFGGNTIDSVTDSGTPTEVKESAMLLAKQNVEAEGRTTSSASDKLGFLNMLQSELDAKALALKVGTEVAVEDAEEAPQELKSGYFNYLKALRAEAEADGKSASAKTE